MTIKPTHTDVVVIGAGFSGLRAALDLRAAGKTVQVLEARERVGGRSKAGEICGQVVDFGGQWIGPQQARLHALAQALGVAVYPQHTQGNSLLSRDGKVRAYTLVPKLPLLSLLELGILELRWQSDIATLPADAPWQAERAREWDAESLESWMRKNMHTEASREALRALVGTLACIDASQISYLFFLDYLRRGQGLQTMIGIEGGAQQDKFVGGAWQIAQRMAQKLEGCIALNTPVKAVEQDADGVRVITEHSEYSASRVIVAVPPILAARIRFTPGLPARHAGLLQRMPMGAVIKIHVAYETPFWRARGLNGSVIGLDRPLGAVFDQTLSEDSTGVLVGLIDAHHAVALSALSPEARRESVVADLVHYFGDDAAQPKAYVEQDWMSEEWSLGGYGGYMTPGVMTGYGDTMRTPHGRIHWAGTETATEFGGYFEGALQAGSRAAEEVLKG